MELAAGDCRITQDPLLTQEHNLFYRIQNLFALPEILSIPQGCNTEKKIFSIPVPAFLLQETAVSVWL